MIASRFWFGLLALALSGVTLVVYLAISMHDRLGARMVAEGLSADSRVVGWYLKNSAREGAAQLIRFAANDGVARSLAAASRAGDLSEVDPAARRQLKATLTKIAAEVPKDEAFDAVFAVSQSGEVVAYIGFEQAVNSPDLELGGYPVVADALHGYVRDDTLLFDRLYRVVARPVEFELGQLPAGAIVGARLIDDEFAAETAERTGTAVAFYANGRRQAAAAATHTERAGLDQLVSDLPSLDADENYREKGRTDVHSLADGLSVVYARLPGEAWQLGAGYAVARRAPRVGGFLGVLNNADAKDKDAVNRLVIIALALGATAVGLLLSFWEYNVPLNAFRRQVKALSAGSATQLSVEKLRGPYRQIGLDLNLGLERRPRAAGGDEAPISVGFEQMFGEAPAQPAMSAFGLPPSVPAPAPNGALAPAADTAVATQPAPDGYAAGAFGRGGATSSQAFVGSQVTAPHRGPAQVAASAPAVPAEHRSAPVTSLAPTDFAYDSAPPQGGPDGAPRMVANVNGNNEIEPEWTQVYHDFVRIKQDCGEAVDGFTFERFTATLRKNRDTLMRQHGVQHVQFSAYVKQGRAALKAKPVRE